MFGDYATLRDNFNRANENPLASGWSSSIVASNTSMLLSSNVVGGAGGGVNSSWYTAAVPGAAVEAYISVVTQGAIGDGFRIYTRIAGPGTAGVDAYFAQVTIVSGANNDSTELFRLTNASATQIGVVTNIDWLAGNKIGIRSYGDTHEVWRHDGASWTMLIQANDDDFPAAGFCGIGSIDTSSILDDFYMGDIVSADQLTPKHAIGMGRW